MRHWDPDGPEAPVGGVPAGCRAVVLVDLVKRNGKLVEVRDRQQRRKTSEVVLVRDPAHPLASVSDADRSFAVGAGRRRWTTILGRYGDRSFDVALSLVRGDVVDLACQVDDRGNLGDPRWWQPTRSAAVAASSARTRVEESEQRRDVEREVLAEQLVGEFPEVASALRRATYPAAISVVIAAGRDLLAGIEHAGPRAFTQAHFDGTKAHDVRAVLTAAGVPSAVLERLGLRRGDRIGLGGPIRVTTADGSIDLGGLRGPITLRLDQPDLAVATEDPIVVVIENLQPAEIVCARYRNLPVVYTAGQFGDDAVRLIEQLVSGDRRVVAIVDADLGGVRIASRVLDAAPGAEIIDVGSWPHPERAAFPADGAAVTGLRALAASSNVAGFASAVLERGYPVEQELATLDIVRELLDS